MKRLFVILTVLFFAGCSMLDISNTPTKKVEEYLNKYQILDKEVLDQLDSVIDKKTKLNDENKKEYRELIKKQYKDLQYKDLLYDDYAVKENEDSCLPELHSFRLIAGIALCESEIV